MHWKIDSAVDHGDHIVVRVQILTEDNTLVYDQNSIKGGATDEEIRALCDEMCVKHEVKVAPPKQRTDLKNMKSG